MAIMRVIMVKLLCQAVMGHIPPLGCLLSGARRCRWLWLVLSDIKWPLYLRILALGSHAWLPGARVCAEPGLKEELD
jgi:hypothetical protein